MRWRLLTIIALLSIHSGVASATDLRYQGTNYWYKDTQGSVYLGLPDKETVTGVSITQEDGKTRRVGAPCGFVRISKLTGSTFQVKDFKSQRENYLQPGTYEPYQNYAGGTINLNNLPTVNLPPLCVGKVAHVPQGWNGVTAAPTYQGKSIYKDAKGNVTITDQTQVIAEIKGLTRTRVVRADACGGFSIKEPDSNINGGIVDGISTNDWRVMQANVMRPYKRNWECQNGQFTRVRGDASEFIYPKPNTWIREGDFTKPAYTFWGLTTPFRSVSVTWATTLKRTVKANLCGFITVKAGKYQVDAIRLNNTNLPIPYDVVAPTMPLCQTVNGTGVVYFPNSWQP